MVMHTCGRVLFRAGLIPAGHTLAEQVGQFNAVPHSGLPEEVVVMVLDRGDGDEQLLGDLLVGAPRGDELDDLALARGDAVAFQAGGLGGRAERLEAQDPG